MSNEIDLTDYADNGISVSAAFDRKKLNREKGYEGHLMVKMQAKDPGFKRPPVSIVLCLDRSGSMAGDKLESVKETARKIVENLSKNDEVAIVVYDDAIDLVQKRIRCSNKEQIYSVISSIYTGGMTNLSGGLLESFKQVNEKLDGVKRIMLLTDGLANRGVTGQALTELVKKRDSTCTVSTFGYGNDCDQELLADMAKAGEGNYYYIGDTKDVKDVFARELGGLLSCMAQNIKVTVKPNKGNKILEVLNDYTVDDDSEGIGVIRAEDIYADETKYILVKMKIGKPAGKIKDRPFSIARVEIAYDDLKLKKSLTEDLNVKVEFVKPSEADKDPVLEVAEQVAALRAAKAQIEAVQLANVGNFRGAQEVLTSGSVGLVAMADAGSEMAEGMVMSFNATAANFTQASYDETYGRSIGTSARGYSRSKSTGAAGMSAGLGTAGQKRMLRSFQAKSPEVKTPLVSKKPKKPSKGFGKKRSRK